MSTPLTHRLELPLESGKIVIDIGEAINKLLTISKPQ